MAIQVSGTEVISNARALTNIASVDATTVASFATAGVGGGDSVPVPTWGSPTTTISASSTWSKPGTIGADDWVIFYAVGGGGGRGNYNSGGSGGSAVVLALKGSAVPASVVVVVGAGGTSGAKGGDTKMTFGTTILVAYGGFAMNNAETIASPPGSFSMNQDGSDLNVALGSPITTTGGIAYLYAFPEDVGLSRNSIWAGGGGDSMGFSSPGPNSGPGISTYAGNGGSGGYGTPTNGVVPGGGAGGTYYGSPTPSTVGGNGNVRIYY